MIRKRPSIFYGWWIVIASTTIMMNTSGILLLGFTAVFEPIAEEFSWSYAQVSFGASLRGLETGLLVPLVGFLVDRWGTRRLVYLGTFIVVAGLILLSQINSLAAFYGAFALISVGMSACTGTVFLPTIANWFRRRIGVAIGVVSAGVGLGGLMVPVITILIDTFQWRTAMLYLAGWYLVTNLLIALIIRHRPERYGYLPDGDSSSADNETEATSAENADIVVPARQVLKKAAFWRLGIISMCCTLVAGAVVTHIMPCLSSININRSAASIIALSLPLVSIGGRLGGGWLGDRFNRKLIYSASILLIVVGMVLFALITRGMIYLIVPFMIFFGLGWGGTITCRPSLLKQYYDKTKFGTILGIADGMMMLGQVIGIPIAGWVFDTWSSYQGAWFGFAVVSAAGLVMLYTLAPPEN
jgi:MFS family permease